MLQEVQPCSTSISEHVDLLRLDAGRKLDPHNRAALGQFMTPAPIARLMAGMLRCASEEVSLLDAGAGIGSLLGAVVEALCARPRPPRAIRVTAYEIDPVLVTYLKDTLQLCAAICSQSSIEFASEIITEDFIAHAVDQLANPLFISERPQYTCAILNPPYRKIQSDSLARRQLRRVGLETSNLYTGFLAVAIHLLAPDGEIVAITPRSFCNGPYFRPFRELLLRTIALRQFYVFDSREEAFREDTVLQENIILSGVKSTVRPATITITSSSGPDDDMSAVHEIPYTQVVHPGDPELFLHLVPDQLGVQVAAQATAFSATLADLGITVSTGRVVDFRASSFLRAQPADDTVPLIYPLHLIGGTVSWPKPASKKPNAIVRCDETRRLLAPNECYVLVKRFSSKEEARRVVATVYDPQHFVTDLVGFENHLNYFHQNGHGLDYDLARGLAAFLNSTLVDEYFRQFNGHTQVNATDLRNLRYPTRIQLCALGQRMGERTPNQQQLDDMISREFLLMGETAGADPIRTRQRIDEALAVLRELGLPRPQQNERSALTLLALLDLTPDRSWSEARDPLCGITPMMEFFAQHYGKLYKPNTRETVRRQTVHQFLDANLIVANPDEPSRPINSPKAVYQIERATLELLRTYTTDQWERNLRAYLASTEPLKQRYAQVREMQRIPIKLPSGETLRLSPGGQNILIKQIIDEFASRFTPGGEILYLGDTDEKFALFADERLRELGISIDTHGKMPDVIIYHTAKNWLVLIEAVTSHGPIDPKRRNELRQLFASATVGLVYVTAFLNRQAMKEYLTTISWETEVWVADAPEHLIHFNGERFLGPY
jgi:adenine-specific DNA-methyltransferase